MSKRREFSRLDLKTAYPWPVDAEIQPDITDMDMSDAIYGPYQPATDATATRSVE